MNAHSHTSILTTSRCSKRLLILAIFLGSCLSLPLHAFEFAGGIAELLPEAEAGDYIDNGDGTVTDKATGLIWQKSGAVVSSTSEDSNKYDDAQAYCQQLDLGSYQWRVPTVDELAGLVEPERNTDSESADDLGYAHYISSVFFPLIGESYTSWQPTRGTFITSTPTDDIAGGTRGYNVYVDFYNGRANALGSSSGVLCVAGEGGSSVLPPDSNRSCDSASSALVSSNSVSADLADEFDKDYFRLEFGSNQYFEIWSESSMDLVGFLLDSSCNELDVDSDSGDNENFWLGGEGWSGTYYLAVSSTPGHTGSYTIKKKVKESQGIYFWPAFQAYLRVYTGASEFFYASASSGLPVGFTSTTPAVCTIADTTTEGVTVNFNETGVCEITASQKGDSAYSAASSLTATIHVESRPSVSIGTLQFAESYQVSEGDGEITIQLTRTGGSDGTISAAYNTEVGNNTATAGADYLAAEGSLKWEDGDKSTKTITLSLLEDSEIEDDETIYIALNISFSASTGWEPGSSSYGGAWVGVIELTITDNDTAVAATVEAGYLKNLNVRGYIKSGISMHGGFEIQGQPVDLLVLAQGPSLRKGGAKQVVENPKIGLYHAGTLYTHNGKLMTNTDWRVDEDIFAANRTLLDSQNGWFDEGDSQLADSEAALLLQRLPAGVYSAVIESEMPGVAGEVILNLSVLCSPSADCGYLTRINGRAFVNAHNTPPNPLYSGFTVAGGSADLLIVGNGPWLKELGIGVNHAYSSAIGTGYLANPEIQLYDAANTRVSGAYNSNWHEGTVSPYAVTEDDLKQVRIIDTKGQYFIDNNESALVLKGTGGRHSVVMSGSGGLEGDAVLNIYLMR